MIFRQPQKYIGQYLLIPVRAILFFPMLISLMMFFLLMKAYIASIGIIAFFIVLGIGWLFDKYLWSGFSNSGVGELLGVLVFLPLWVGVAWALGTGIDWLGRITGLKGSGVSISKAWDWFTEFLFDAKYQDSPYDLYGPTFAEPRFEDFDLEAEEYYAYNRRFSFREWEFVISIASAFLAGFAASYYLPERKFAIGIAAGLIVLPCLLLFDQWYSRTYAQYPKVRDYNKAKKIHESIQTEIRKRRIDAEFTERRLK